MTRSGPRARFRTSALRKDLLASLVSDGNWEFRQFGRAVPDQHDTEQAAEQYVHRFTSSLIFTCSRPHGSSVQERRLPPYGRLRSTCSSSRDKAPAHG